MNYEKKKKRVEPSKKIGQTLQVQEIIDYFVLADILEEPRFVRDLHERMGIYFKSYGVNVSYMSQRVKKLAQNGHVELYWNDPVNRYNLYCRITDSGVDYLKQILKSLPQHIQDRLELYESIHNHMKRFDKWNLS